MVFDRRKRRRRFGLGAIHSREDLLHSPGNAGRKALYHHGLIRVWLQPEPLEWTTESALV